MLFCEVKTFPAPAIKLLRCSQLTHYVEPYFMHGSFNGQSFDMAVMKRYFTGKINYRSKGDVGYFVVTFASMHGPFGNS